MGKQSKGIIVNAAKAIELRRQNGLNQSDFWKKLGVTQSGGSRYESGRRIPASVRKLMYLVYIAGLDAQMTKQLAAI